MTAREDAAIAAEHLRRWAAGDQDALHDAMERINDSGINLIEELREKEGDARGLIEDIADEITKLQTLVRGALFLAREAMETLAEYPSDYPPTSRAEVLEDMISDT